MRIELRSKRGDRLLVAFNVPDELVELGDDITALELTNLRFWEQRDKGFGPLNLQATARLRIYRED